MSNREWTDGLEVVLNFTKMADDVGVEEANTLVLGQVRDFLLSTGSKKIASAKNIQKLTRKVFSVRVSNKAQLFAQIAELSVKHLVYRKPGHGPTIKSILVRWVSTPRGMVYSAKMNNSPLVVMVLSHVFDRMSQRAYDNELSRMQAIGEFFWNTLSKGGQIFTNSECETMLFTDHGLYLGHGYCIDFSNMDDKRDEASRYYPLRAEDLSTEGEHGSVLVLKTFVNDLKPWQEKKKQWMEEKGGYEWKMDHTIQKIGRRP